MKRIIPSILLLAFAGLASAQEITLNTPVTRTSEGKYTLNRFDCNFVTNTCVITLDVKDSGNNFIRYFNVVVPDPAHPSATFTGMLNAAGTARASETGAAERRADFRIRGYLVDQGYFTAVTLIP